jgi:hypothetical protein
MRHVLVIVSSDPRQSPRVAEAIRIAAGGGAWKKVDVRLALCGPAVLALSEFPDELVDEDNFTRYLPIIGEFGHPIYVEADSTHLNDIGSPPVEYEAVGLEKIAELATRSDYVLRF